MEGFKIIARSAACRFLAQAWDAARGDNLLPTREALPPAALRPILPLIVVFDYVSPEELVFRLMGTRLTQLLGVDLTGRNNHAMAPPGLRAERIGRWRAMAEQPCGGRAEISFDLPAGVRLRCESVAFPILPRGGKGPLQFIGAFEEIAGRDPPDEAAEIYGEAIHSVPQEFAFIDIGKGIPS